MWFPLFPSHYLIGWAIRTKVYIITQKNCSLVGFKHTKLQNLSLFAEKLKESFSCGNFVSVLFNDCNIKRKFKIVYTCETVTQTPECCPLVPNSMRQVQIYVYLPFTCHCKISFGFISVISMRVTSIQLLNDIAERMVVLKTLHNLMEGNKFLFLCRIQKFSILIQRKLVKWNKGPSLYR